MLQNSLIVTNSSSPKSSILSTNLLLIALQIGLNISLIFESKETIVCLIAIIFKILFDIVTLYLLHRLRNKITINIMQIMFLANTILGIVLILILRSPKCIYLSIYMCYSRSMKINHKLDKIALTTNVLGKISLILSADLTEIEAIIFICSFTLIIIDIQRFYQCYKKINESRLQFQLSNINQNIWMQRIQDMNIQVLILNYKDLCVNYINQCFFGLFGCVTEEQLSTKILYEFNFQIPLQQKEILKNSSLKLKRIRETKGDPQINECKNIQSAKQILTAQTKTLDQILTDLKQGNFNSLLSKAKVLDISCIVKLENSNSISLSGQIISNEQEITIFLQDVSQYTELNQQKVKDDFKSKIIESFSHEMKTPLNSAKNFIEAAISDSNIGKIVKDQYLLPAFNSLRLQSCIINDIIDFSNYYANSLYLQTKDFKITELVNEISELFQQQFQKKQIGLEFIMEKDNFQIFNSDYNRLVQIIVNLLSNSLKFSQKGKVVVRFKAKFANVLCISIIDQGEGIQQDDLERIQETLKQFQETSDFIFNKSWHGFGLLISSILLRKLSSTLQIQLLTINSKKNKNGTKVKIFVENQNQGQQIQLSRKSVKFATKINSSNNIQTNTYIVTSVMIEAFTPKFKTIDFLTDMTSVDKSSDSFTINKKIQGLNLQGPKLLRNLNDSQQSDQHFNINFERLGQDDDLASIQQSKEVKSSRSSRSLNFSIKQLKFMEDQESQQILKNFIDRKKCNCRKILSVDDEVFNQNSLELLLKQLDFEVLVAYNGQQALDQLNQLRKCCDNCQLLDLILMDYQMPILNGIETTKRILEMIQIKQIPEIKIVGLTAFTSESDIEKCYEAGMTYVLSKPLSLKDFKEVLSHL